MSAQVMTEEKFLALLPEIRQAARKLGYAMGLHGSLARDFDLIAVPWVEGAAHPDDLAEAVKAAAGGCRAWRVWWSQGQPKPHGRRAYAFDWGKNNYENKGYCDLSVLPRLGSLS